MSKDPKHYTRLSPEPISVIRDWNLGFCLGNVVKYISRAGHKDGNTAIADLEKARRYIEFEIEAVRATGHTAHQTSPLSFDFSDVALPRLPRGDE